MVWIKNIAAKLAWVAAAFVAVKAGRPFLEGYGAVIGLLAVLVVYWKARDHSGTVGELVLELWNDWKDFGLSLLVWVVSVVIIDAIFDLPTWKVLCLSLLVLPVWFLGTIFFYMVQAEVGRRRRAKAKAKSPQPEEKRDSD